jgi:hypothetical protein
MLTNVNDFGTQLKMYVFPLCQYLTQSSVDAIHRIWLRFNIALFCGVTGTLYSGLTLNG